MNHLLVEDDQPRRTRQQDLLEGAEQRETHVLVIHQSETLDHIHQFVWVRLYPVEDRVQALVLRAIDHWAAPLSTQEHLILIDSPVGCPCLVLRVPALAVFQI